MFYVGNEPLISTERKNCETRLTALFIPVCSHEIQYYMHKILYASYKKNKPKFSERIRIIMYVMFYNSVKRTYICVCACVWVWGIYTSKCV